MSTRRIVAAGLLGLVLLAGCAAQAAPGPPATPEQIAAAFAVAYASGDTPEACDLAGTDVRSELDAAGRCARRAYWSVSYWLESDCTVPGRGRSFEYNTNGDIDGHRGFDIVVSNGKVTRLTPHRTSSTGGGLCSIYSTVRSS